MKPIEINEFLQAFVIGQQETLKFVSVAIFKHLQGERYGNLLMIGNSGTGKTTIMRGWSASTQQHEDIHASASCAS
jgi:ATP-dependent Clp protease ATP-binding subunit ClpX